MSGISSGPNRLSDIGITFSDLPASEENPLVRNILDLNEGTLTSKLAEDFDAFRKVFEFDYSSSNLNMRIFSRTNALAVNDFTVSVSAATPPALPTATVSYGSGQTTTMEVTEIKDSSTDDVIGYTLKGRSGTVLEGIQLIYSSTSAGSATISATQGLADQLFNISDDLVKRDNGALDVELKSIESTQERLQTQIDKIDEQVERFRQQLLDKFGEMERAVARVNALLQSIDAQNQTRYSN